MSSRLTVTENKVTAITVELEATRTEQQLQKKKMGGGRETDFWYVITEITDLVMPEKILRGQLRNYWLSCF